MEKVVEYVRKNYEKMFGNSELIIIENDSHFQVKVNKDESPLILSKDILN